MIKNNKLYDSLKFLALIVIPATNVLIVGLGVVWGWGDVDKIVGSLALADTFLGSILQLSSSKYNKEQNLVAGEIAKTGNDEDTGLPNLQFTLRVLPEDLLQKDSVRFDIKPGPADMP